MSRGWVLGERGELMVGMVRSTVRDMFWWDVSDLKITREREGEVGDDLIWCVVREPRLHSWVNTVRRAFC